MALLWGLKNEKEDGKARDRAGGTRSHEFDANARQVQAVMHSPTT